MVTACNQNASVLQQGGRIPISRHHHVAGGDKRLSMRVLYCQGKQSQKQKERTPESVDHDSPPEISFIGKREKSEGKPPEVPNVKTGSDKIRNQNATDVRTSLESV